MAIDILSVCCWLCFNFFTNYTHFQQRNTNTSMNTHMPTFTQPFCSGCYCRCVCTFAFIYDANHHHLLHITENSNSDGRTSSIRSEEKKYRSLLAVCVCATTQKSMAVYKRVRSNERNKQADVWKGKLRERREKCIRVCTKELRIHLIKHTSVMEKCASAAAAAAAIIDALIKFTRINQFVPTHNLYYLDMGR